MDTSNTTPIGPLKRRLRWLAASLGGLLILVLAYLAAALVLGVIPVNTDYQTTPGGVEIYIGSSGIHTDIIVPLTAQGVDWRLRLPQAAWQNGTPNGYLAFGWGDRAFFLETPSWSDLKVSTSVIALSGFDDSLMHLEYFRHPTPSASMRRLLLSPTAYQRLILAIEASFKHDSSGKPILIPGTHYRSSDAFFAAEGHYSPLITCNEWTRRILSQAGVRVPRWSPFPWAIMRQLPDN